MEMVATDHAAPFPPAAGALVRSLSEFGTLMANRIKRAIHADVKGMSLKC